jgi:hypothetical protein
MFIVILVIVLIGVICIGAGVLLELNAPRHPASVPDANVDDLLALDPFPTKMECFRQHLHEAIRHHPHKNIAAFETVLWLVFLWALLNHLLDPRNGLIASIVWYLAIGPHEIGHIVCIPFGEFLTVAGGSIWQILFWLLLALYTLFIRWRVVGCLVLLMVVGHSFINLAVYIRDAQERQLPLLFGLGPEHHDWGRLLDWMHLTAYDNLIAGVTVALGVTIIVGSIIAGILATWMLPYRWPGQRFYA